MVPLRRDNPEWLRAWKTLYGYRHSDFELPHLQALLESKRGLMRTRGEASPRDVLDRAGIDIALVNATQLAPARRAIGSAGCRMQTRCSGLSRATEAF